MKIDDHIVLVNEHNEILGIAPKLANHNANTPLHRGFSVFLFNSKGELLLQQRSHLKKTWPLIWSNSVCGHPMLNESSLDAAKRRAKFELGIETKRFYKILPNFSYKAELNGIVENELCPVLVYFTNKKPKTNDDEVENIKWIDWQEFADDIKGNPGKYSPWCEEETKLLEKNQEFQKLYKKLVR